MLKFFMYVEVFELVIGYLSFVSLQVDRMNGRHNHPQCLNLHKSFSFPSSTTASYSLISHNFFIKIFF